MQQEYSFYTSLYHFLDFNFGGGFRGMRKSALMGCMSHRAAKETTSYWRVHDPPCVPPTAWPRWPRSLALPTERNSLPQILLLPAAQHPPQNRTVSQRNSHHSQEIKSLSTRKSFTTICCYCQLEEIWKKGCIAGASTTFSIFFIYKASEGHKNPHLSNTPTGVFT